MNEPVVFFGTGPVAAESLRLLSEWATIEAVITKPKPAHHKGTFPVLDAATELGLPVSTVTGKVTLNELFMNKPFKSSIAVLIDFGIIVSQEVINYFPLGIVNSHFSLLPQWRGADPITFSILSGQKQTGVSLMLLVEQMDEGPLLSVGTLELYGDETTPLLTNKLIKLSNELLQRDLPTYVADHKTVSQSEMAEMMPAYPAQPSYSRKLTKADSILDFTKSATQLECEIRAFTGWPKSRTQLAGKDVVITKAHVQTGSGTPGSIWKSAKELGVYTTQDILAIDALKPAGKGEMSAAAFLAGYGSQL